MKKELLIFATMIFLSGIVNVKADYPFDANDRLHGNDFTLTGQWVEKTNWDTQKISVYQASTILTDPCPNCIFIVRLKGYYGDEFGLGSIIKLYETKEFIGHDGSNEPGKYKLKSKRADFTLLNTTLGIHWYYNS